MITKISGTIDSLSNLSVIIENSGIYYSVSMPPVLLERLSETHRPGDEVLLYTHHYIEGGVGVGNLFPRLIGFLDKEARAFYEIFTTVKGLGERKALQALTIPISAIANAVEQGDVSTLKRLPGIGGRMADKIVAELRGKLTQFTTVVEERAAAEEPAAAAGIEEEAMEILIAQLGFRRVEAENLIRKALSRDPKIQSVEGLVQSIFRHHTPARSV